MRVPRGREPYVQASVPTWVSPVRDEKGNWIVSHVINQDIVGWVGQGAIADRTAENLRSSDIGITMMRKRFFDELDKVAKGLDPSGIIRDPQVAACISLPDVMRRYNVEGVPLADYAKHPLLRERLEGFRHHYGQPPEVRWAFEEAMGLR
jgi:5,5'-dehydrodivanillate O-demethylase oxygenase subunit